MLNMGDKCDSAMIVLQGRLHIICGSELFESDRGAWTVLGANGLRNPDYTSDFVARVMEPSRLLKIARHDYELALKQDMDARDLEEQLQNDGRSSENEDETPATSALRGSSRRTPCTLPPSCQYAKPIPGLGTETSKSRKASKESALAETRPLQRSLSASGALIVGCGTQSDDEESKTEPSFSPLGSYSTSGGSCSPFDISNGAHRGSSDRSATAPPRKSISPRGSGDFAKEVEAATTTRRGSSAPSDTEMVSAV